MRAKRPRVYRRFSLGASDPVQFLEEFEPRRGFSIESDVLVPTFTAIGAGGFVSPLIMLGVYYFRPDIAWWLVLPVAFFAIAAVTFMSSVFAARETAWHVRRQPLDVPLIEHAEPDTRVITVRGPNMAKPEGLEVATTKAPRKADVELETLHTFLRGCETDTTVGRWAKPIGRPKYTRWRDALIESGWAKWRSENGTNAGWELKYPAEDVIEAITLTDNTDQFLDD